MSTKRLVEGVWTGCGKDLLAGLWCCTVGQREFEVLGGELLDVWAAKVVGLLNLNDLEDLCEVSICARVCRLRLERTWMVLKRARWREAMSW